MFDGYSAVNDDSEEKFLSLRQTVMDRKQPRRIFVQGNTSVGDGEHVCQIDKLVSRIFFFLKAKILWEVFMTSRIK